MERFQWKAVAMLMSSFQTILFLDADAFPVLKPDGILAKGAEPLASTGLITWPDLWTPTSSHFFYKIAGNITVPDIGARATTEAGIMVLDKARHTQSLLLAFYYNFYGPSYYYPLLSQGAPGEGDKETFLHGELVLNELSSRRNNESSSSSASIGGGSRLSNLLTKGSQRSAYWDVKKMPEVHGRVVRGRFKGMFMQQMDPMEDYRAVTKVRDAQKAGQNQSEPLPTAAQTLEEGWRETNKARFMFFHHSGVKLDFTGTDKRLRATDFTGKWLRLWGDPGWLIERTGRDVEKELWKGVTRLYCFETDLDDVCRKMQEFYFAVY